MEDLSGPEGRHPFDELPFAVWVARAPSGEVLYTNRAFRAIMGMEAVPGASIEAAPAVYGIYDRDGRPYSAEALPFTRALASGQSVVVDDLVIHRHDDRRVWVRAFANPVRNAAGVTTHVVVAFTDISAEVRAQAERAEAEKHLAVAIHHAPVLLFTVDRDGVLSAADGALRAQLDRGRRMVGMSLFDAYKDHPSVPGNIRRALAGETVTYSVEVQNLVLDVWLGPVRDIAGKLTGAIGVATDVTESRRLQARIAHEDRVRALGTLAASVAHEINNPLTYVIGSVSAAAEQAERLSGGNAPELRDLLGPALIGTARIRQVTRDLGTFVRAEGERLALVDIGAVVGAALRLLRKEIEARAHLVEDLGECPPVRANEARLTQVLVNLLMNAWQALPEASPARHVIGVRTTTRDGHAIIEVWDSGPGVPEARREEIFNPFVTTKEIGQGTGLGLFVCRNIVDSLAGNITVHDGPAGGALFRVVLPEANPSRDAHEPAAVMPASSTAASRRSIVIIDDDDLVARVLATLLQGLAYEVRTVQDGREGLALLLGDESIDLAYCDIMMKGMTGIDIFEELQRRAPGRLSRLVFMTGGAFTERARDFVERHRDICVHKPFDIVTDARHRLG